MSLPKRGERQEVAGEDSVSDSPTFLKDKPPRINDLGRLSLLQVIISLSLRDSCVVGRGGDPLHLQVGIPYTPPSLNATPAVGRVVTDN